MPFKNINNGKEFGKECNETLAKFKVAFEVKMPDKIAEKMGALISKSFKGEQYPNGKSSKWKKRKIEDAGRGLLVGPDADLIKEVTGDPAEINVNGNEVQIGIGSDKVYAQIHNEGLEGNAFGKHKFKMPQRQFMPIPGEELPPDTQKEIDNFIDGIMDNILG